MIGRIVEVAGEGRYLHMDRGFLVAEWHGAELGRVPLDDVSALIASAHGVVISNNLLVALAERGAPVVMSVTDQEMRSSRNPLIRTVLTDTGVRQIGQQAQAAPSALTDANAYCGAIQVQMRHPGRGADFQGPKVF